MLHFTHVLARQKAPDSRDEENREIDRKADAPQDRAKRGPVTEIGEHIGDAHEQKKNRQFIDQALGAGAKLRQQHGYGEERKGLEAVLMRTPRARPKGMGIERGVA